MLNIGEYKVGIIFLILPLLAVLSCGKQEQVQKISDMRFLFVVGDVVVTDVSGIVKKAITGDTIASNDTVSVNTGALADILYGETGLIRVKENTTFSASQTETGILLKMGSGNILAGLPKLKNSFKIQTHTAVASVRGTTFNVMNNANSSQVAVTEGTVSVNPVKNGTVLKNKSIDKE